ncbi:MAG: biopolymer transporter ExbD [Alphaproteobacteria bacterium]|nr:MAG: biopolymer transporter ExbD [Alphaproteobacteria bacterium]
MRPESPRPRNDEERILPLINVVFLLLIFFMLAGRLVASTPFRIEPPHSASEESVAAQESVVLISTDGRLALDGTVMEAPALKAAVAERMSNDPAARMHLKADGRVEATRVVAVMELLHEAGVERLKLLTVRESR